MVRAPCCEKMGLKKGPWTPEEDQVLIAYIQRYGHGNWRALPKQAGLLRCGKSCRLRWTNYLRPDIKRGNFTREEEEAIIKLHELLGNRWSAIAARLPGRTDNEIKNVWHTHLKKRLHQNPTTASRPAVGPDCAAYLRQTHRHPHLDLPTNQQQQRQQQQQLEMFLLESPLSPPQQQSSSDLSSPSSSSSPSNHTIFSIKDDESLKEFNGYYWSDAPSMEDPSTCQEGFNYSKLQPIQLVDNESMDFWLNLLVETDTLPDI
ncbi:hypothetical protein MRB53_004200 [Persea americana]|uniref:Uncharacterized protein n=1 Tax=Persea americana TaxID=3435 RepID=A0ACC2MZE3_PERAE|nr:hypothetical protein MRB53_004200 [Persea americana]